MEYTVESKSTDGVGGWSEWAPIAAFKYESYARQFARYVMSYQQEEAPIDRVQLRVMRGSEELPFK